jgi:hypothetical protein
MDRETGYRDEPEDDFCYCEEDKRCAPCEAALARYRAHGRQMAQADARPERRPETPLPWKRPSWAYASIGNGLFARTRRAS